MEMKQSLIDKLDTLSGEYLKLQGLLSQQEVVNDNEQFAAISKQFAELETIYTNYQAYKSALDDKEYTLELVDDKEFAAMAKEELESIEKQLLEYEQLLKEKLIPKNPEDDTKSIFIEIRAAAGGDEACLFASDLLRMYLRFAERHGYQYEITNKQEGTQGGFKEVVAHMTANAALYGIFKFESGAHRVQRVPATESQGRIHTSTCTVAVLPEAGELAEVEMQKDDLRIDTFRSSGAGGQHVNTTDSAVRITHIPTGVVAECQQERSQHKNKAKAMALLKTRINDSLRTQKQQEQSSMRKSLVGTGDRSERIRTYNFPQGRMTDHRINLTLYKLEAIMDGDITELFETLRVENNELEIAQLSE